MKNYIIFILSLILLSSCAEDPGAYKVEEELTWDMLNAMDFSKTTEYIEKQVNLYYNKAKETRPQITKAEARKEYANIYKKLFGISYDDPCPNCNGLLCIRKQTRYDRTGVGHFIGCTNYPECGFSANSYRRFSVEDKSNA